MFNNEKKEEIEEFNNFNVMKAFNCELMLKAIFFGAIFYLLSLPEVYKLTSKCCKSVDPILLHAIVFTLVYYVAVQFI